MQSAKTSNFLLCPLCAEPMMSAEEAGVNSQHLMIGRPCCGQPVCQSCMYRHIRSIWEARRSKLACPIGCGHDISDAEVRSCLRLQHTHTVWRWIGHLLLQFLLYIGWIDRRSSRFYKYWHYLTTTVAERRDLLRYEQWSLSIAFHAGPPGVFQHCLSCDYTWEEVVDPAYRRSKLQHDRKAIWASYQPPRPEPQESSWMRGWVEAANVKKLLGEPIPWTRKGFRGEMDLDGRLMVCAKCFTKFCGLCRQPWDSKYSHSSVSCATYGRRNPPSDDFVLATRVANARMCPGCSIRTSRISGCNNMACSYCGADWCYACEAFWDPSHSACVIPPPTAASASPRIADNSTSRTFANSCAIL